MSARARSPLEIDVALHGAFTWRVPGAPASTLDADVLANRPMKGT